MPDHLLNLKALHAAAPGVLDAIFGPDGHHPGAPSWIGAVSDYKRRRVMPMKFVMLLRLDGAIYEDYVLDCRIPSVAARLLGVCARAMDPEATGPAWVERGAGFWSLRYRVRGGHNVIAWRFAGTWLHGSAQGTSGPDLAIAPSDEASFIAALVTALAPRIAALGGDR